MVGGEVVPHFIAPVIQDNPTGWGPCDMPDQFKDMPYQPFSKGDRLGKVINVKWSNICLKFVDISHGNIVFVVSENNTFIGNCCVVNILDLNNVSISDIGLDRCSLPR